MGAAMLYSPLAQAPKSTILQRSLQNGLKALLAENSANWPHLGQVTKRFLRGFILGVGVDVKWCMGRRYRPYALAIRRLINYTGLGKRARLAHIFVIFAQHRVD